jgi:hypothetical protein
MAQLIKRIPAFLSMAVIGEIITAVNVNVFQLH